jgi:hypothetical protein
MTLAAMSLDRLLAIAKPVFYKTYITEKAIKLLLVGIWLFVVVVGVTSLVVTGLNASAEIIMATYIVFDYLPTWFSRNVLGLQLFFCAGGTCIAYAVAYRLFTKKQQSLHDEIAGKDWRSRRFLRMAVGTMATMLLLWLPSAVLVSTTGGNPLNAPSYVHDYVMPVLRALADCNSFINPLLYCVFNSDFRKAYLRKQTRFGQTFAIVRCDC